MEKNKGGPPDNKEDSEIYPKSSYPSPQRNGFSSLQRAGFTPYEPSYLANPRQSIMKTTLVQQSGITHTKLTSVAGEVIFGKSPVSMQCPYCQEDISTSVMHQPGTVTWLAIGGLLALCCWAGCCLIPLYIDRLKDTLHTCPNCRRKLGISRRIKWAYSERKSFKFKYMWFPRIGFAWNIIFQSRVLQRGSWYSPDDT